jgi:hypothetical protein
MSHCFLHVGPSPCTWAICTGLDIDGICQILASSVSTQKMQYVMSPFTIHVLHHGGDCKDGGLRWLRNIGTCLSGYLTSYTRKRYLIILGQCIGKFLWESGRNCECPQPVENVSVSTVFGSHIFSRAVAANCPCLVKSVCVWNTCTRRL